MRIVCTGLALVFLPPVFAPGQVTGLEGWNIYIDPGHSQQENMGVFGYSEAEKNLGVAWKLWDLLINTTDIDTVYLSRTNDQEYVTLSDRTTEANWLGTDWYHSLHSNAPSTTSNNTLLLWGQYYDGREKIPNGGKAMSDIMVDLLTRSMRTTTSGSIGDCSYYTWSDWCARSGGPYLHVNRVSTMPSELSESGYHTNPVQNQLNMNDKWKRLEAYSFFWSILQYHGITRPPVSILTGIISDIESGTPVNGAVVTAGGVTDITDTYESLFHKYSADPEQLHNGFYFLENVHGGTVELTVDASGYRPDTLQVVMVDTFFTFCDVQLMPDIPTTVVFTDPAQGDTNVSTWGPVIIDFSQPMNRASVRSNLVPSHGVTGSLLWANGDRRMIYLPESLAADTSYTITLSSQAVDLYGNHLECQGADCVEDDFTLRFTTGSKDNQPPVLVSLHPPANAENVAAQPVVNFFFNEPLDPASISSDIIQLELFGQFVAVAGRLTHLTTLGRSLLCFFPAEKLQLDSDYVIRIRPGLQDLAGNVIGSTQSYRFRTARDLQFICGLDDFEGSVGDDWRISRGESPASTSPDGIALDTSRTVINLVKGGHQSLQVEYAWADDADEQLIHVRLTGGSPKKSQFTGDYLLQVYLYGDAGGNQFRFCVRDNLPQEAPTFKEVSPWYAIDFVGWRLVSWDMVRDGTGGWQGDGELDGTLGFDSIQLRHRPGAALGGVILADDLQVAYLYEESPPLPVRFLLHPNYPNPFNRATTIVYDISQPAEVSLVIYDLRGRQVRTLVDGRVVPGTYAVVWDGSAENRNQLASGIYIARLQAQEFSLARKLLLVK